MQHRRYVVLDGLRGVAAATVLLFHIVQQRSLTALPYAGLAVDFFYMLSGFVVAIAYEPRLLDGRIDLVRFLSVRLTRLYPLVLLGTAMGIGVAMAGSILRHTISPAQLVEASALGLLLLPSFVIPHWPTAYPFNRAAWSLTFEMFVNILYAAVARHLTTPRLVLLIAASAASLILLAWLNDGIRGGNNQQGWAWGFARVMFPFFAGVLIARLPSFRTYGTGMSVLAMAGLLIALVAPVPGYRIVGTLYVLLLFPLIVRIGAQAMPSPAVSRICGMAGTISYPLYILQAPILRIGMELLVRLRPSATGFLVFGASEALAVLAIAWVAFRYVEVPVQSRMASWRRSPATAAPIPAPMPIDDRPSLPAASLPA